MFLRTIASRYQKSLFLVWWSSTLACKFVCRFAICFAAQNCLNRNRYGVYVIVGWCFQIKLIWYSFDLKCAIHDSLQLNDCICILSSLLTRQCGTLLLNLYCMLPMYCYFAAFDMMCLRLRAFALDNNLNNNFKIYCVS